MANAQASAMQLHDRSLKEYDDSLVYMINLIQNTGNDLSKTLNNTLQLLSNKLNEVVNIRNELQNTLSRENMQDNSFSRPAWS